MGKSAHVKALQERLSRIEAEEERLRIQKELVLDLIREANGEPEPKARAPRANVKKTVLDMLTEAGTAGLNAAKAVDWAADHGIRLDRGSVSSLLSRLKNDGTVTYDGSVYRLKSREEAKEMRDGVIHPLQPRKMPGG